MQSSLSVPKTKPLQGEGSFCGIREGAQGFLSRTAGKCLVLADGASFASLLPVMQSECAVNVLWDGDALSLFSVGEVGRVLASGGEEVMLAARFFARVRGIPCALFPVLSPLDGVWEREADLTVAGERRRVALAPAQVFCDMQALRPSCAEGYARLLLSRLALFEAKAAGLICRRPFGGEAYERAFALTEDVRGELAPEEIVARNAALRRLEGEGCPAGEGRALLPQYAASPLPALTAQRALSALYYAFFRAGAPRRFLVPDYRARAARAGVAYSALTIPCAQEYAARALALERVRGELLGEIAHLRSAHAAQNRAVRILKNVTVSAPDLTPLLRLAERVPSGLCAVIRDFGLMEKI